MLAWLSVWGQLQICIWPNWCHCHSLSVAPVNPDWFYLRGFTLQVPAHLGSPYLALESDDTILSLFTANKTLAKKDTSSQQNQLEALQQCTELHHFRYCKCILLATFSLKSELNQLPLSLSTTVLWPTTQFFTCQMPFLLLNQQHKSTEGIVTVNLRHCHCQSVSPLNLTLDNMRWFCHRCRHRMTRLFTYLLTHSVTWIRPRCFVYFCTMTQTNRCHWKHPPRFAMLDRWVNMMWWQQVNDTVY